MRIVRHHEFPHGTKLTLVQDQFDCGGKPVQLYKVSVHLEEDEYAMEYFVAFKDALEAYRQRLNNNLLYSDVPKFDLEQRRAMHAVRHKARKAAITSTLAAAFAKAFDNHRA